MSAFDPTAFLDASVSTPTEKSPPLPVGDYTAVIGTPTPRSWQKGDRSGVAMDIPLTLEIPAEIQNQLGLTNSTVKRTHSIFLDLTEQGSLDLGPGRNRGMRLYREATDSNKSGDVFTWRSLEGKVVLAKVGHEEYNGDIVERIQGVAKA